MEYNKESFKKALKECGIIRWENHFEKVVKAYLKAEAEQLVCENCGETEVTEQGDWCLKCLGIDTNKEK